MTIGRFGLFFLILASPARGADAPIAKSEIVASVDRSPITAAEVEIRLLLGQQSESAAPQDREAVIEDLIDRRLMSEFLVRKGIKVPDEVIELQWTRLQEAAGERKVDLSEALSKLGYSEEALKHDLWLPLAWTTYVKSQLKDDQIRSFFDEHKPRFDGTTRHVRHLIKQVPSGSKPDEWDKATAAVKAVQKEIADGKIPFADAAKAHSDSPSKASGGDVGFVRFRGDLPQEVAEAVFALPLQKVSEPVKSPYGVHLVIVEEERPGDLSLEDARGEVLEAMALERWNSQAAELRKKARITRVQDR